MVDGNFPKSAAPAGSLLLRHWPYVALALAAPLAIGLILALMLKVYRRYFRHANLAEATFSFTDPGLCVGITLL